MVQASDARYALDVYARGDYVRAASLLRPLADAGSPLAQTYLGYMYSVGSGVPKDDNAAVFWLTRAAIQGVPNAQFLLGVMYDKGHGVPQDFTQAYFWYDLAAARGTPNVRGYWGRVRDAVGSKITRLDIEEAQTWAGEWQPIPER